MDSPDISGDEDRSPLTRNDFGMNFRCLNCAKFFFTIHDREEHICPTACRVVLGRCDVKSKGKKSSISIGFSTRNSATIRDKHNKLTTGQIIEQFLVESEDGSLFQCNRCSYCNSTRKNFLRHCYRHIKNDPVVNQTSSLRLGKDKIIKSRLCTEKIIRKFLRISDDGDNNTTFKCNRCFYTTDTRKYFLSHSYRHIERDLANRRRKLKPKSTAIEILNRFWMPSEDSSWFQCKYCSYNSNKKKNFLQHCYRHTQNDRLNQTSSSSSLGLDEHNIRSNVDAENIIRKFLVVDGDDNNLTFKCNRCSYSTDTRRYFLSHSYRHIKCGPTTLGPKSKPKTSAVKLLEQFRVASEDSSSFQCKYCYYNSDKKRNFLGHCYRHVKNDKASHGNPHPVMKLRVEEVNRFLVASEDGNTFQCNRCFYTTDNGRYFLQHCYHHVKNEQTGRQPAVLRFATEEVIKRYSAVSEHSGTYRCNRCSYITDIKGNFLSHSYRHMRNDDSATGNFANFKYRTLKRRPSATVADGGRLIDDREEILKKFSVTSKDGLLLQCSRCSYTSKTRRLFLNHCYRHIASDRRQSNTLKTTGDDVIKQFSLVPDGVNLSVFQCNRCSYATDYKRSFVYHASCHIRDDGVSEELTTHDDIIAKFRKKTKQEIIRCRYCSYSTNRKRLFKIHVARVHRRKKADKLYSCPTCSKKFDRKKKYVNHLCQNAIESGSILKKYAIDTAATNLQCKLCPFSTPKIDNFLSHASLHEKNQKLQCDYCEKIFLKRTSLREHISRKHLQLSTYKCDVCGLICTCKRHLSDHQNTHTGARPYVCDLCGKSYTCYSSLSVHRRKELGQKDFKCEFCGTAYISKFRLNQHVLSRHSEERNFVCTICGKAFKFSKLLKEHSSVHSDERPFSCETCGKTFKLMKTLQQHYKVHRDVDKTTRSSTNSKLSEVNALPKVRYFQTY